MFLLRRAPGVVASAVLSSLLGALLVVVAVPGPVAARGGARRPAAHVHERGSLK